MNMDLNEVTGDPTQPNPALRKLGTFHRDGPTGGWDNTYVFTPMVDSGGQPAAVRLSGLKTLRASVLNGAMDWNYLVFVPDPTVGVLRAAASVTPANGSTSAGRDPEIKVVFTDRDTAVVPSTIRLTVNGTDVTGASTITDTPEGAEITYQGTYVASSVVNATVSWGDNDAIPVTQNLAWSFTTGIITPSTLFIEIEDFNYSDAEGVNPGQYIAFGAPDGSLLGRDATQDIDSHDNDPGIPGDLGAGAYRPLSDVEAGKGPSSIGEQDRTRGSRTITADWVVGWTGQGEWLNYTRDFPTERYYVYARMASGAGATVPMHGELSLVTSDPTQPNQTVQKLGDFSHPRDTGGWDGTFIFKPLIDASGNQTSVRLSGVQTLRYGWLDGAHDAGYLALVPGAPPVRSRVVASSPPISREYPNPYAPLVQATISKEDTGASDVKISIDGADRTADATITDDGGSVSVALQLEGAEGARHTATIEWTDTLGVLTHTFSFRQGPPYSVEHLFIELEDWNTEGGQYFPSNPAFGHDFNAKGLYMGKGGVSDVDFHDSGNPEEDQYRNGEVPNIGIVPHNDANRNGAGERPGFEVVSDYKMGWTDAAGDWYNYTRTFPAGTYTVWAKISHGDANATMGGQLDLVTSDRSQPNQSLQTLGEFVAPASGNWDGFSFVPLTDGNGDLVQLQTPAGEHTIRYSVKRNGGDLQYLMIVPQITLSCPENMTVGNDAGQCSAAVSFTATGAESCSPASGSSFPVGTTTVTCVAGSESCSFTVTVEDREAPVVTVRAGANPGGKTKAKNGENNGFFQLLASDNCDAAPKIYIKDASSSFVAGPFSSGVNIKLNTNADANKVNKGGNGLDAHVLIDGDAEIYATDDNGNVSPATIR